MQDTTTNKTIIYEKKPHGSLMLHIYKKALKL